MAKKNRDKFGPQTQQEARCGTCCWLVFFIIMAAFCLWAYVEQGKVKRALTVMRMGWNLITDGTINEYTQARLNDNAEYRPDEATRLYKEHEAEQAAAAAAAGEL